MSGRWPRIVAGILVLAVAVVLFVVLSPGDDGEDGATSGEVANGQTERPGDGGAGEPEDPSDPDGSSGGPGDPAPNGSQGEGAGPEAPEIVVRDGRPAGGAIELEVTRGERVAFEVRSDAAEEVHVHGYDVTRDLNPGESARIAFEADLEGVYEVELHGSGAQIAELTVHPG